MRLIAVWMLLGACAASVWAADAQPIERLAGDGFNAATVWTEPVKAVTERTRGFDPVSGLAMGLWEGTMASVQRVADLLQGQASSEPARDAGKQFRYSF